MITYYIFFVLVLSRQAKTALKYGILFKNQADSIKI